MKFFMGVLVGVCLMCAQDIVNERDAAQSEMQKTADAYFAGQQDATAACKGEMVYD